MERPQGPAWVKHSLETETYRDGQKGVIEPMTATKKKARIRWQNTGAMTSFSMHIL